MGAHRARRTPSQTSRIAGRGALTAAAALALTGGSASLAFAGEAPADQGHESYGQESKAHGDDYGQWDHEKDHGEHGGKHYEDEGKDGEKDCAAPTAPGAPELCDVLGPIKDKADEAYEKYCPPEETEDQAPIGDEDEDEDEDEDDTSTAPAPVVPPIDEDDEDETSTTPAPVVPPVDDDDEGDEGDEDDEDETSTTPAPVTSPVDDEGDDEGDDTSTTPAPTQPPVGNADEGDEGDDEADAQPGPGGASDAGAILSGVMSA